MGKLWRKVQDKEGQSRLQEVELPKLRIAGPTVIYLSGFLTNNNRPGNIAGSIKSMQELLRSRPELKGTPEVYGWSHTGLRNLYNLAAYNYHPSERASDAGYDLGAAVLMPLVAKDFRRGRGNVVSGTPLPLGEAKKNLRNVTLFGYSAGAIVAQETYNATFRMMKDVGYAEKDAREALQEVVLVATGVFSRYTREKERFTTAYLVATNDRMMRAKNWIWGTAGTLLRTAFTSYRRKKSRPLSVTPLSDTSVLISAPVRASLYEWKENEGTGERYKKSFRPLYPKWLLRRSYHELQHYVTQDEQNNPFAHIVAYSLVNAANRSGRLTPLELIAAPAADPAYEKKISAALRPRKLS